MLIRRGLLTITVIACLLPPAMADDSRSGTTVIQELQRLFRQSGQPMPSFRTQDLPYATSPQMHRVRRRDESAGAPDDGTHQTRSSGKKKKPGLFRKLFSKFRRDQNDARGSAPQADRVAVVVRDTREYTAAPNRHPNSGVSAATGRPTHGASVSERPSRHHHSHGTSGSADRLTVRPAAAAGRQDSAYGFPGHRSRSESTWAEDFDIPFEETPESESQMLDLDAVAEIPDIPGPDDEFTEGAVQETRPMSSADVPESSPFTGARVDVSEEFSDETVQEAPRTATVPDSSDFAAFVESDAEDRSGSSLSVPSPESAAGAEDFGGSDGVGVAVLHSTVGGRFSGSAEIPGQGFPGRGLAPDSAAEGSSGSRRASERLLTREEKIEARRHLSGFLGFCPVVLRDEQDLADADEQYQAVYGLKTYWFSSREARQKFVENPTRYVPVAGGADVVLLTRSGERRAGSIRHALWYHERLYLFHSEETKHIFAESPALFAGQY